MRLSDRRKRVLSLSARLDPLDATVDVTDQNNALRVFTKNAPLLVSWMYTNTLFVKGCRTC